MKTYLNWTWSSNLIYHLASVFGLAPFIVRNNSLHPLDFTRKIYAMLLAVLVSTWLFFIFDMRSSQGVETSALNQFVYIMYLILYEAAMLCTLFKFAFKSRQMIDIMYRIIAIKEELAKSGIEDLHDENRKRFYAKIIFTNSVNILMRLYLIPRIDDRSQSTEFRVIFWLASSVAIVICHNVVLIFSEIMMCIGHSFKSLNNRLQGTTRPEHDFILSCIQQSSPVNEGGEEQASQVIVANSKGIHLAVGDVEKIGKLHRELCHLVQSTTNLFAVTIVLVILQHFTRLLSNCYSIYAHAFTLTDAHSAAEFSVPFLLRFGARITKTVLEFWLIADACTSVSNVANATKTILFTVWNKFNDEKLQNEFFMVSLQFLKKPVTVSAFGFFDLGYSYVFKIFYAMLAYFIIMVQLDASRVRLGT